MEKTKNILIIVIIFFLPQSIFAWGKSGHRIIGEIAETLISQTTKQKTDSILGNVGIAMVANWGDFIKSDPKYNNYYTWHYTNFDANLTRQKFDSAAMSVENGECIFQVKYLIEYLKRNPNDSDMLKMLIHIVGDMFMPMHLGQKDDKGGNLVKIKFFNQNTNIHALWDDKLIEGENLSYSEYTNYLIKLYKPEIQDFKKENINNSAWKTYRLREEIYSDYKLTEKPYQYIYKYKNAWENQLVEAAILLAEILNHIYN